MILGLAHGIVILMYERRYKYPLRTTKFLFFIYAIACIVNVGAIFVSPSVWSILIHAALAVWMGVETHSLRPATWELCPDYDYRKGKY